MTTQYIDVPADSDWVLATEAEDYLLQNTQGTRLHVTVQSSAPSAGTAYHELKRGEGMVAVGTGSVYVRNPEHYPVKVVVTE